LSIERRYNAVDEISRDDPRFKCRMCGKPIFGVMESDKDYSTKFFCSSECQQASSFSCIIAVNYISWIPSGLLIALFISELIRGSFVIGLLGFLFASLLCNLLLIYLATTTWELRKQIIRNRENSSKE
jgi:hypothetical protein